MSSPIGLEPRSVLLVRLSHLGDVVHALPVFHALRVRWPDARIAWAVQPEFSAFVEPLPGLERVVRFERRGGAFAWWKLRAQLAAFAPELAVDAQGNWKSAAVMRLSGAARRIGLARADWRERTAHGVLHASAPPAVGSHALDRMHGLARWILAAAHDATSHAATSYAATSYAATAQAATTADATTLDSTTPSATPSLRRDPALSVAERENGRALLTRALDGCLATELVLLHLSDERDVRGWPLASWIELARTLARANRAVLVVSGPAEAASGARVRDALRDESRCLHLVGQRGLRELAALFAAAAERGARLVACDSGPLHVACSVELPTLALAGPQDPLRTGPWPPRGAGPHDWVQSTEPLACRPCRARRCAHARGPVCMSELAPAVVSARLLRV